MRLLSSALAVLLLLGLLTWLLLRGIDTNAPAHAVTLKAFDDFALAEASLHRDVLQARAGLLRNYDHLVAAEEAMNNAVTRLRSHTQMQGLDAGPIERLSATVADQQNATEQFKSVNALLQNSLSYVGMLSTSSAFSARDAQLAAAAGALAAAVLYVSRDPSPDAVKALQERIDRFAAQAPDTGPDTEAAQALLSHARLLRQIIPAADETLRKIVAAPSAQPLEDVRALLSAHRTEVEATAQQFRLLLYVASLLLLGLLTYVGLQLRGRAIAFETERARLMTRIERSRRMQTVGSLASGIAHNFNNIISAILGYSEMLEARLARGVGPAKHLDEIRQAAERGRDLVDNILTFGRRRDAHARPVQVRALLAESASLLRASLPGDVELIVGDVAVDAVVSGEPAQLQQIILNLCFNAAQAVQGGGRVSVTVERCEVGAARPTSHGELAPGRYVCLAVGDNGRGFDERVARRLFEPFFTTRLAGTGLGLATVREIVHDHDGAMHVESRPGHGSRFEAWLPAATAEAMAEDGPRPPPLGSGETVLVVQSDIDRLALDEEMLAALGYEPVGFEHATDAIAACRAAPDRFDAIVVSHASHGAAGLELAHALHRVAPRRPVLLATASTIDVRTNVLAEAGISELLSRPLVSTELAAALARCVRPGV